MCLIFEIGYVGKIEIRIKYIKEKNRMKEKRKGKEIKEREIR